MHATFHYHPLNSISIHKVIVSITSMLPHYKHSTYFVPALTDTHIACLSVGVKCDVVLTGGENKN